MHTLLFLIEQNSFRCPIVIFILHASPFMAFLLNSCFHPSVISFLDLQLEPYNGGDDDGKKITLVSINLNRVLINFLLLRKKVVISTSR